MFFVLVTLFQRTFLPPAVAVEPTQTPPVRIACSSTARDTLSVSTGRVPSGKVSYVVNGTKALVAGYDPQAIGSDTADVTILAEANGDSITLTARSNPQNQGRIPSRGRHKLPAKKIDDGLPASREIDTSKINRRLNR